jgi:hypothetical protein
MILPQPTECWITGPFYHAGVNPLILQLMLYPCLTPQLHGESLGQGQCLRGLYTLPKCLNDTRGLLASHGRARSRGCPANSFWLQPEKGLLSSIAGSPLSETQQPFSKLQGTRCFQLQKQYWFIFTVSRALLHGLFHSRHSENVCVNECVGEGANEAPLSGFPDKDSVWLKSSFHLKMPGSFLTPLIQEVNSSAFQLSKQ